MTVCESCSLNVFDDFTSAEDVGASSVTQMSVERYPREVTTTRVRVANAS